MRERRGDQPYCRSNPGTLRRASVRRLLDALMLWAPLLGLHSVSSRFSGLSRLPEANEPGRRARQRHIDRQQPPSAALSTETGAPASATCAWKYQSSFFSALSFEARSLSRRPLAGSTTGPLDLLEPFWNGAFHLREGVVTDLR